MIDLHLNAKLKIEFHISVMRKPDNNLIGFKEKIR